jgi:hypothetical protein
VSAYGFNLKRKFWQVAGRQPLSPAEEQQGRLALYRSRIKMQRRQQQGH